MIACFSRTQPSHRERSPCLHVSYARPPANKVPSQKDGNLLLLPQRSDRLMKSIPKAYSSHTLTSSHGHLHPLLSFTVSRHFPCTCSPPFFKLVIFIKNSEIIRSK